MARLYDRLITNNNLQFASPDGYTMNLSGFQVIDVHNIADYVNNHKDIIKMEDLPALTPPFEKTWLECSPPPKHWPWDTHSLGFGIHRIGNPDELNKDGLSKYFNDARWVITISIIEERRKNDTPTKLGVYVCSLDEFGKWLHNPDYLTPEGWFKKAIEDGAATKLELLELISFALLSLSFMNIKNVKLIDNPPPAKLSKRHEKKYGVPLVTYKTLKVLPMRKVNQNDYDPADDSDTSIPRSLHIARGHFKDYRNGPGLFGKYKDIFWWDAHVRGSAETGVVVKDYDVQAPEHETS